MIPPDMGREATSYWVTVTTETMWKSPKFTSVPFFFPLKCKTFAFGLRRKLEGAFERPCQSCPPLIPKYCCDEAAVVRRGMRNCFVSFLKVTAWDSIFVSPQIYT